MTYWRTRRQHSSSSATSNHTRRIRAIFRMSMWKRRHSSKPFRCLFLPALNSQFFAKSCKRRMNMQERRRCHSLSLKAKKEQEIIMRWLLQRKQSIRFSKLINNPNTTMTKRHSARSVSVSQFSSATFETITQSKQVKNCTRSCKSLSWHLNKSKVDVPYLSKNLCATSTRTPTSKIKKCKASCSIFWISANRSLVLTQISTH